MTFRKKFYWIAPTLLVVCIFLNFLLSEISLAKLEEDPFPWCCSADLKKELCDEKLHFLSPNLKAIEKLRDWTHGGIGFSIATFGFFVLHMLVSYCCDSQHSMSRASWVGFFYRIVIIANLSYITAMTSFADTILEKAVKDIKITCMIAGTTERGNIWTDWDAISAIIHIEMALFVMACFLEFFCEQLLIHEDYSKHMYYHKKIDDDDFEKIESNSFSPEHNIENQ